MSKPSTEDRYQAVAFDPHRYAIEKCADDSEFRDAYLPLDDEFAALAALLAARKQAGLTQAEVDIEIQGKQSLHELRRSEARQEVSIRPPRH